MLKQQGSGGRGHGRSGSDHWLFGPRLGERSHVFEVPGRESLGAGELATQVVRQSVDDLGPPAILLLPGQDVASRLPVEKDEFAVDRDGSLKPGGPDPLLEFAEDCLSYLDYTF